MCKMNGGHLHMPFLFLYGFLFCLEEVSPVQTRRADPAQCLGGHLQQRGNVY